ncbi:hypothetical protein ACL2XP_17870 [Sodalis sp. RH21]|uniref:hypothetical protein n=1 Tax=unclassified Sodalis (in: enterobacteria) TaxID=2636512 RepID=UPI0039B50FC1
MSRDDKIANLEYEITSLRYEIGVIKKIIVPNLPDWAKHAKHLADEAGLKPSPYGEGYDLCRMLDLLDQLNILSDKRK